MTMSQNSCTFTGHRPKCSSWKCNEDNYDRVSRRTLSRLQILII